MLKTHVEIMQNRQIKLDCKKKKKTAESAFIQKYVLLLFIKAFKCLIITFVDRLVQGDYKKGVSHGGRGVLLGA